MTDSMLNHVVDWVGAQSSVSAWCFGAMVHSPVSGRLFFVHPGGWQRSDAHSADIVQVYWKAMDTRSIKQNLKGSSSAFIQLL